MSYVHIVINSLFKPLYLLIFFQFFHSYSVVTRYCYIKYQWHSHLSFVHCNQAQSPMSYMYFVYALDFKITQYLTLCYSLPAFEVGVCTICQHILSCIFYTIPSGCFWLHCHVYLYTVYFPWARLLHSRSMCVIVSHTSQCCFLLFGYSFQRL